MKRSWNMRDEFKSENLLMQIMKHTFKTIEKNNLTSLHNHKTQIHSNGRVQNNEICNYRESPWV